MARSRVQSIRSNVSGARPASQEPGTIYTNFADLQIGVADTARQPKDLVAVRFFATTASYTPGQLVVQNGSVYRATAVISPGAFDPTKWQEITVQSGSGIWVGDSPRAEAPVQGQLLWESDSGDLFVWYEDADGGQWVQINAAGAPPDDFSQPGRLFGAADTQVSDVTAITALMADAASKLYTPVYLHSKVNLSSLYTHPDTESFIPVLNAFFASPEAEGKHVVFDRKRAWFGGNTRPSGGALGPQGQYITPPRRCTIEWEREWDFTGWPTTTTSPSILRREGSYGTANPVTDAGGLVKGVTDTLTLGSGNTGQYVKGSRALIRATAQLTTLTGAFTLADAEGTPFCARAEGAIVESVTATQIKLTAPVQDTYPLSAVPVVQPYLNEPEIRLVNPQAIGTGWAGSGGERLFNVFHARNFQIEGGLIRNFGGDSVRVLSSMGGSIRDLEIHTSDNTDIGGCFYIGDDTSDFLLDNVRVQGNGGQPFMLSGSMYLYGVSRRVKFRDCVAYGSLLTGFSQHNMSSDTEYVRCHVIGAANTGFDIRSPNTTMDDCLVRDAVARAVFVRISPNGLKINRLTVDKALAGIVLENASDPIYDYDPGDITITNCDMRRLGGAGATGGIIFNYGQLRAAAVPTLGKLRISGNYVEMTDNGKVYEIAGKWTSPVIVNNEAAGAGTGSAMHIHDSGNGVGNGPSNLTLLNHVYPTNMGKPLIQNDSGRRNSRGHIAIGATSTEFIALTGATTLDESHYGCEFSNLGATGSIVITLPGVNTAKTLSFFVLVAQTIVLQATTNDKFRKGKLTEGAANGTLTIAANIGAFVRIEGTTTASWNCVLFNDTADLTVA